MREIVRISRELLGEVTAETILWSSYEEVI